MKKLCLVLLSLLILALLSACGATLDSQLAADAEAKAQDVVNLICQKDYQAVTDMAREDIRESFSPAFLAEALDPVLEPAGALDHIGKYASTGTQDKATQEVFAVVAVVAHFENGKHTFTITFDENLDLVGLYVR